MLAWGTWVTVRVVYCIFRRSNQYWVYFSSYSQSSRGPGVIAMHNSSLDYDSYIFYTIFTYFCTAMLKLRRLAGTKTT